MCAACESRNKISTTNQTKIYFMIIFVVSKFDSIDARGTQTEYLNIFINTRRAIDKANIFRNFDISTCLCAV